jgi:DNA-directed RNA polymerase specialized sigma24 family protein
VIFYVFQRIISYTNRLPARFPNDSTFETMNPPNLEEQFITILRDHKKLVYKVCHSYTTNKDDFKDLEQEILIQVLRCAPFFGQQKGELSV